jgi:hypothetical protein
VFCLFQVAGYKSCELGVVFVFFRYCEPEATAERSQRIRKEVTGLLRVNPRNDGREKRSIIRNRSCAQSQIACVPFGYTSVGSADSSNSVEYCLLQAAKGTKNALSTRLAGKLIMCAGYPVNP